MTEEKEQVLKFPDAATAFMWAEEMLSKTSMTSHLTHLMRTQPGYGEFTRDELYDLALTVAGTVERVSHPGMRFAYKYIYGRDDNYVIQSLVAHLVDHVRAHCNESAGKHHLVLVRLAHSVAEGTRGYCLAGRRQSQASVARDIGVYPQNFSKLGWLDIMSFARRSLREWIDSAEKEVKGTLDEKGMIA